MSRKGQIFYLYNRVGVLKKKKQLSELVPEARIVLPMVRCRKDLRNHAGLWQVIMISFVYHNN